MSISLNGAVAFINIRPVAWGGVLETSISQIHPHQPGKKRAKFIMLTTIEKLLKRLEDLETQMTIACDLKVSSEARQHLLNELMVQHRLIAQEIMELRLREKMDGSE